MSLGRWKFATQATESSVFGYIRRIEESKDTKVPKEIKRLCISFYSPIDYFTKHGRGIRITKPLRNIATSRGKSHMVYGHEKINLNDKSIQEYKWTFRIRQDYPEMGGFHIGIDSSNKYWLNGIYADNEIPIYLFSSTGGAFGGPYGHNHRPSTGPQWKQDSKIELVLRLNIDSWSMITAKESGVSRMDQIESNAARFIHQFVLYVDGNYKHAATHWIANSYSMKAKYHLAVVMSEMGQEIELIEFYVKGRRLLL